MPAFPLPTVMQDVQRTSLLEPRADSGGGGKAWSDPTRPTIAFPLPTLNDKNTSDESKTKYPVFGPPAVTRLAEASLPI